MSDRSVSWYPPGTTLDDQPLELHRGTLLPFMDSFVARSVVGHEAPNWSVSTTQGPGIDGVRFGYASAARTLSVPVFMRGTSADRRARVAQMAEALTPRDGAGMLVFTDSVGDDDGTARFLKCIYRGGMEGDMSASGLTFSRYTLHFEATDPLWYDTVPALGSWSSPADAPTFLPFRLPFRLAPFGLAVEVPLIVGGSLGVDMWPVFDLTAPFTRARVTNDRTGVWWELVRGSDDRLVPARVVTTPGEVQVSRPDTGGAAYGWRSAGSQFFPVRGGDSLSVVCEGSGPASRVDVSVDVAWLTCW